MSNLDAYNASRKKKAKRASGTKHKIEDWSLLYDMYFSTFDLDIEATLKHFGLYDKTKSNGTPRQIWSSNLYNHRQEYEDSKRNYYQSIGVCEEGLIQRLNKLSESARSEMTRYQATCYLLEFLDKRYVDNNVENKAQKLIVEFQEPSYVEEDNNSI